MGTPFTQILPSFLFKNNQHKHNLFKKKKKKKSSSTLYGVAQKEYNDFDP